MTHNGTLTLSVLAVVLCALCAAGAEPLILSPGSTGGFDYLPGATRTKTIAAKKSGRKPLVETHELFWELPALTNFADCASAVAFDQLPRRHLLHSWRTMGVKLLKTVRFDPEGDADRFRREVGFIAFCDGADGTWLPGGEKELPPGWRKALAEARDDWRLLLYLKGLADRAAESDDGQVRIESRRVSYWFGWMPVEWENADVLRLESVGYARRLEQLLKLPPAKLPTRRGAAAAAERSLPFTPYGDWPEKPEQVKMKAIGQGVDLGGGLRFSAGWFNFTVSWGTTNAADLASWTSPGKCLDFSVYVPGERKGEWLPYHFHCDLDPHHYGWPRAPARGRSGFLFGIDERFRPTAIAYGVGYNPVSARPVPREYGRDYPEPGVSGGSWQSAKGKPGGSCSVSVSWTSLFGHWPMLRKGKFDTWYVALDRSPATGKPVVARVLWPKGHEDNFWKFAGAFTPGSMTGCYKPQLQRVERTWTQAAAESGYQFAGLERPAFHRFDVETDTNFYGRLVRPLLDANANAWELVWEDKEHKHPKFARQPDSVKRLILKNFGRMRFLSYDASEARLKYLEQRWAGDMPPEYTPKPKENEPPATPDMDYDPDQLQLDDKEF